MTLYEGITLGFISCGILLIIWSFFYKATQKSAVKDEAAMDDEAFRTQVSLINEKILELNDYHTFVQNEIEGKHKELLFLYQMMAEKEKSVRQIQVDIEKNRVAMNALSSHEEKVVDVDKSEKLSTISKIETNQNSNKRILELKNQGYKETEIAKILNIGQGEVRLVLNLYE